MPQPCQRTAGHKGPHACNHTTALYDVLTWEIHADGRTVWRKLRQQDLRRGEVLPELKPHCLELIRLPAGAL
jgi:hypothetical protein